MKDTLIKPRPTRQQEALGPSEDWEAAGWAGMAGGAFVLFMLMAVEPLFSGASPWTAMRFIAAIALGRSVLPPPYTFDPMLFMVAILVNFTLSMVYARALALAWSRLPPAKAVGVGLAFGCLLYAVNFHALEPLFPWFAAERGIAAFLANALFGAITAFVYKSLERPPRLR